MIMAIKAKIQKFIQNLKITFIKTPLVMLYWERYKFTRNLKWMLAYLSLWTPPHYYDAMTKAFLTKLAYWLLDEEEFPYRISLKDIPDLIEIYAVYIFSLLIELIFLPFEKIFGFGFYTETTYSTYWFRKQWREFVDEILDRLEREDDEEIREIEEYKIVFH